jgi:hypothetical protein
MEIKGKVVHLMPLQTGEGKNGTWKKQDFVIETDAQYPKKVCISAWGDKFDENLLTVGRDINVSFDVESREYNTKWYTDLKAWRIEAADGGSPAGGNSGGSSLPPPPMAPLPTGTFTADDNGNGDLPF